MFLVPILFDKNQPALSPESLGFGVVVLCTSKVPAKSKFMKSGCVGGAQMLLRADMLKIPKDNYGASGKFTEVQEKKQVGTKCLLSSRKIKLCMSRCVRILPYSN